MSAPLASAGVWTPQAPPAEAAELVRLLELARRKRDDVRRDLDELRHKPERLDQEGRLLARVTQEVLAAELQLWTREVTNFETTALLLAIDTNR